ncbi:MAG: hypothetical protein FE044_00775 [Thermoplasmata archaeon]|nr:MAG: hypothetical protein FE044_00775 [Thermoplasmata archaeon]KAA0007868.1 MAG: hypothetical protein FE036_02950 [Thermoplasmata archaeon]
MIEIWRRDWKKYRFNLFNFILVWTIPAIIGEAIGRIFGIKFLGMAAGFIYSLAKTQYDYLKTKT